MNKKFDIGNYCYWFLFFDGESWNQNDYMLNNRKEINLSEFESLFNYSFEDSEAIRNAISLLEVAGYKITNP